MRIISAVEAANLIEDGQTVTVTGLVGNMVPELILEAIETRYLAHGHPRGLVEIHPWFYGWPNGTGLNRWAHPGLCKRMIGSTSIPPYLSRDAEINQLIHANGIEYYVWPANAIFQLHRAVAAGQRGYATTVGIDTFADPRREGGRMNAAAREELIRLIEIDGEEHLFYRSMPMHVALLSATTADTAGNLCCDQDGLTQGILLQATAVRNSGGIVIAEVQRVVDKGSLHPLTVEVPGHLVDYVVVNPDHKQHAYGDNEGTMLATTGTIRQPLPDLEWLELDADKIIARRGFQEFRPGQVVNLGAGIGTVCMPRLAHEENATANYVFTVEHGSFGEHPIGGHTWNPTCIQSPTWLLDWYSGGGLDVTVLGAGQIDRFGNVNVARMGDQYPGTGGFTDIAASTPKVVFLTTFTTSGLEIETGEGSVRILQEGRYNKFVPDVETVCFSGPRAHALGREVLYVTERAVLRLGADGLEVVEVAPGIDLHKQVLELLPFPVRVADNCRPMDECLFRYEPMYLSAT